MPEVIEPSRDVLTDICGYCGIALYPYEVAAEITGNYIDYNRRVPGTASFAFCAECWERVQAALTGDIDSAVEKRNRIFHSGGVEGK